MSQLTIDPAQGKEIEWEVGATYDMAVRGTVTAKNPDGSYVLTVESVEDTTAEAEPEAEPEMMPKDESAMVAAGAMPKRKSAVMSMLEKE